MGFLGHERACRAVSDVGLLTPQLSVAFRGRGVLLRCDADAWGVSWGGWGGVGGVGWVGWDGWGWWGGWGGGLAVGDIELRPILNQPACLLTNRHYFLRPGISWPAQVLEG